MGRGGGGSGEERRNKKRFHGTGVAIPRMGVLCFSPISQTETQTPAADSTRRREHLPMRISMIPAVLALVGAGFLIAGSPLLPPPRLASEREFRRLMNTVAEGWNEGNASKAADCFATDAIYLEPPDRQLYEGREALFEFFGGAHGPEKPMHMVWHHLAFDAQAQVGFGEYTFTMNNRYHGIVVVKLENGKIKSWREYQYKSDVEWKPLPTKACFESNLS